MNTAGTTASKIQFFVKKAMSDGHIDVTTKKGYAVWVNTDTVICEIPFGKKAVEAISEFAMSKTKEASMFYERIKSIVSE
jgi:hypothetical protein